MRLPGLHCHPLTGDRKGQYAIKLDSRVRLVFTVEGAAVDIVNIQEVSKHYGD